MKYSRTWIKKHKKDLFLDLLLAFFVFALVVAGIIAIWVATLNIPDLSSFEERRVQQSTKIYDRTGEILLYDLHQDVRRTVVPYEEISRHLKNATIAIEDDTFFEHHGVRPLAILRAALANLSSGDLLGGQGGSTITQQVIKNSILEREKTLTRKIKEAILAVRLENVLTKEEILGYYLNESPYGGTIYGVEEASLSFFGKPASDVTLAEAAYLASLPQLPTYYSPYGSHMDGLEKRKNLVLSNMLSLGFITQDEYDAASVEEVVFKPRVATGIRAPHFVFYIRDYLIDRFGEESLAEQGLKVITTLDWELQEEAERIVLERALSNEKSFNAENASLIALDPTTGEILTMVGSRDFFDKDIDGNVNTTLSLRQPGSSFKPFVYAAAFKKGYTPETSVFDLKTQFSTACASDNFSSEGNCYSPVNYDGEFRGPVSLRNALAQSLNIPAVKVLYLAGMKDSLKLARDLGINTLTDISRYGLTLVLGGGEVKLLEMAGAYGTFANEGVRNDTQSILYIEDSLGNLIEKAEPKSQRVLDRDVALQVSDVLSDNVARTPLYGSNSPLYFPGRDVAAKTGTTNDKRDVWILGYTPNLVVGAWAGNNDNRSITELSGLIITPLWREFMDVALKELPPVSFAEAPRTPDSAKPILRGAWFDPAELVGEDSSDGLVDVDVIRAVQGAHSILFFLNKNDPQGNTPPDYNDSQFAHWDYPVSLWKSSLVQIEEDVADEDEEDVEKDE